MGKERLIDGIKKTSQVSLAFSAVFLSNVMDSQNTIPLKCGDLSKPATNSTHEYLSELPSEAQWQLSTANSQGLESPRDWGIEAKIPLSAIIVASYFFLAAQVEAGKYNRSPKVGSKFDNFNRISLATHAIILYYLWNGPLGS